MDDYLNFLEQYKQSKEISDLIDEIKELREYYHTQQYEGITAVSDVLRKMTKRIQDCFLISIS